VPPRQSPSRPVPNERRRHAFTPSFCESCGSAKTEVTTRTDYVLYIRCWACGHVWSVTKPGCEPIGS
jgi:translation initiation factor 2 beta subunit (eIF-2beta)/eIF-5